jgi:hypothetical protein
MPLPEGGSMKLLIDIPKEFEQHFQADRFEDSLHRLSADAHLLAGLYEQETTTMLIKAFATAVPVPPHGRLIDADALLDALLFPSKRFEQGMRELIGDAPTVIPAEEATP